MRTGELKRWINHFERPLVLTFVEGHVGRVEPPLPSTPSGGFFAKQGLSDFAAIESWLMKFLGIIFVSALLTIAFGIYSEAAMRSGPLTRAAIPTANDRTPSHSTSSPAA